MIRSILAAGLAFSLALPALALDLDSMSDAEREAFRAEIRAYLLENPEVIMEAVAVLETREQEAQVEQDRDLVAANRDALFNDDHSWTGGNPDGDITLVEFLDYRCGYCRRAAPDVATLVEMDGDIRLIIKEFPILGTDSERSSRFAIAALRLAGDEAYKAAHDALIALSAPANDVILRGLAEQLELDADAILAEMDSDAVDAILAKNRELAQALKISGTPSFVMNDEMLRGFLPLESMMQVADGIRNQ